MFSNINEAKIKDVFTKMNVGEVSRVDFIEKTNSKGEKYNMVFVWFDKWYTNTAATNLKERIEDPNTQAKFVYEDPWYWIVLPNTSKADTSSTSNEKTNTPVTTQEPVTQQPVTHQQPMMHPAMMHSPVMMPQMMYMYPQMGFHPGYYQQWNMHVPPLPEAPYGHGVMNAYYGPDHGFENPNAVEVSPQDAAMMDEIEKMMDAE